MRACFLALARHLARGIRIRTWLGQTKGRSNEIAVEEPPLVRSGTQKVSGIQTRLGLGPSTAQPSIVATEATLMVPPSQETVKVVLSHGDDNR